MGTKRQKGKHMKRLRSWHHLPNQDRKYRRAMRKLNRAMKPLPATTTTDADR